MPTARKFCPECGQPLPETAGRETVRMDRRDSDKLRAAAAELMAAPPDSEVEMNSASDAVDEIAPRDTMPDEGWLRKHMRDEVRRALWLSLVVFLRLVFCALALGGVAWLAVKLLE